MASGSSSYNTKELKRFLVESPVRNGFNFSSKARRNIRMALFYAASSNGEFFPHFSHQLVGNPQCPKSWSELYTIEDIDDSNDIEISKQWKIETENEKFSHNNRPCGYRIKASEPMYKCNTCERGTGSIMCHQCYSEEYHQGHHVSITISCSDNGGVCDCGDSEAWNDVFPCRYNQQSFIKGQKHSLPPKLIIAITEVMSVLLNYIIDVLSQSSLILQKDKIFTPEEIHKFSNESGLSSSVYGEEDHNSSDYYLVLYNDPIREMTDACERVREATEKSKESHESLTIVNTVHTYGRAPILNSQDISYLLSRKEVLGSTGLASCIRSHRDYYREEMCAEIVNWMENLLLFSYQGNYGLVYQPMSFAFLRSWEIGSEKVLLSTPNNKSHIVDGFLNGRDIPTFDTSDDNDIDFDVPPHWQKMDNKAHTDSIFNDDIDPAFTKLCQYDLNGPLSSRLQYLLYFNIRLWKSTRISFNEMVGVCLLSDKNSKLVVTRQFIEVYPQLGQLLFYYDREPARNIMESFSPQLFQSPTNASAVTKSGFLSRSLAMNFGFFTMNKVIAPNQVNVLLPLDISSLQNRQFINTMYHLTSIIRQFKFDPYGKLDRDIIYELCDLILLFNGLCPVKRETEIHTEYESKEYITVLNALEYINKIALEVSYATQYIKEEDEKAIIISQICSVLTDLARGDLNERYSKSDTESTLTYPSPTKFVSFSKSLNTLFYKIVDFRVGSSKLSFLHPLHAFLTWLVHFNSPYITSSEKLKSILLQEKHVNLQDLYLIFDYPLRSLVLMSQIKLGLWVRNGYSIRSQLYTYHKTRLRNHGFRRDVYATQMFLCVTDSATAIATIIDRYGLTAWTRQDYLDFKENGYDGSNIIPMVEELLSMLIVLVSERDFVTPFSSGTNNIGILNILRRELIHRAALSPMSHSSLNTLFPRSTVTDRRFNSIFTSVTTFIPPSGITGIGKYKLKDEIFKEIDPYYIHYTNNEREECIKILKERLGKEAGKPPSEMVINSNLYSLENTAFTRLTKFTTTEVFFLFLYSTAQFILTNGPSKTDTLLELLLHLIHISVIENTKFDLSLDINIKYTNRTFSNACVDYPFSNDNPPLATLMVRLLKDDLFSPSHPKLRAILMEISNRVSKEEWNNNLVNKEDGFQLLEILKRYHELNENQNEDETKRKKRIAKLRKEKVMANFKQQQNQFIENNRTEFEMDDNNTSDNNGESCIICQIGDKSDDVFGTICHVGNSSVFRSVPFDDDYWGLKAFGDSANLDSDSFDYTETEGTDKWKNHLTEIKSNHVTGPGFPRVKGSDIHGKNASNTILDENENLENFNSKKVHDYQMNFETHPVLVSCGHGMHFNCFLKYIRFPESRPTRTTTDDPENPNSSEFLCPLCKSLNNVFLPSISQNPNFKNFKNFLAPAARVVIGSNSIFDSACKYNWSEGLEKIKYFTSQSPCEQEIISRQVGTQTMDLFLNFTKESLTSINGDILSRRDNLAFITRKSIMIDIMKRIEKQLNLLLPKSSYSSGIARYATGDLSLDHLTTTLIAHTIEALEISLRGRGYTTQFNLILEQVPSKVLRYLRTLCEYRSLWLEFVAADPTTQHEASPTFMNERNKNQMFNERFQILESLQSNKFFDYILTDNLFVEMLTIPIITSFDMCFNTIVRLFLFGEVIQKSYSILLELFKNNNRKDGLSITDLPRLGNLSDSNLINFGKFVGILGYAFITKADHLNLLDQAICDKNFLVAFFSMVVKAITPFLRRAILYAYIYCADSSNYDSNCFEYEGYEADRLCKFLEIPSLFEIIELCLSEFSYEGHRFREFCEYVEGKENIDPVRIGYPGVESLIELPVRLDTYFTNKFYRKKQYSPVFSHCEAAVCMFCGVTVRLKYSKFGEKRGACTLHYEKECGNSCGIYFLPAHFAILLLYNGNGTFYPIPYLDVHGELDERARNETPLFLVKERYTHMVRTLWLQNEVPNFIARKSEGAINIGGWDVL